jgi:hypothetical protein
LHVPTFSMTTESTEYVPVDRNIKGGLRDPATVANPPH